MSLGYDRDWMREHGVAMDPKGRPIVSLPNEPDDEGVDVEQLDEGDPPMAELMRHEVSRNRRGSHGRRRRDFSKGLARHTPTLPEEDSCVERIGRPVVGSERRVRVQTTISQRSRDLLEKHGLTLADVLEDLVRKLRDAEDA